MLMGQSRCLFLAGLASLLVISTRFDALQLTRLRPVTVIPPAATAVIPCRFKFAFRTGRTAADPRLVRESRIS